MPAKSYEDRRAVLTAMSGLRYAQFGQIAAAMGPHWQAPNRLACLRQLLRKMERDRLILRMGVGVYRGLAGQGSGGLGSNEEIVECISAYLRECDGVMPLGDLLHVFVDRRIWSRDERDEQSLRILKIIGYSDRFWQDGNVVGLVSEQPPALVAPPVAHPANVPGQFPHDG